MPAGQSVAVWQVGPVFEHLPPKHRSLVSVQSVQLVPPLVHAVAAVPSTQTCEALQQPTLQVSPAQFVVHVWVGVLHAS